MLARPWLLPALLLLVPAAFLVALTSGSATSGGQALAVLIGADDPLARAVVVELRLPRALAAFAAGGLLALAGALMQALLRNPLADPYVLGVSGGAAVGALLALALGFGALLLAPAAFVGALVSTLIVFALANGPGGRTPTRLLLTGIVVASGWGAVIAFILSVAPEAGLRGMLFWLMGDLAQAGSPWPALAVLAAGGLLALTLARPLNVLLSGELQARALGVAVAPLRLTLFFLAALLTATAVSLAGSIGFVGLVVPHLIRLLAGSDHRVLLPATILAGGSLLLLADTAARTVISPQQLPVGVLTALLGVPLFLWLLHRGRS